MTGKDIFISYSRKDQHIAFKLARKLEEQGLSVWIDQERIDGATRWQKEIVDAIGACRILILLASGSSFQSDNVVRETSLAFEEKIPILPIFLQDTQIPSEFRYQLAGIHRIELFQDDRRHWEAVFSAVQRLMQKAPPRRGMQPQVKSPAVPLSGPARPWRKIVAGCAVVLILALAGLWWVRHQARTPEPSTPKQAAVTHPAPQPPPVAKPEPVPKPKPKTAAKPVKKSPAPPPSPPEPSPEEATGADAPPVVKTRLMVGRYHNRKDFFRGSIGFRENGTATLTLKGLKSGTQCIGKAATGPRPPGGDCSGMEGKVNLKCDDGNTLRGQLAAQTCARGIIHARDAQGLEITFRYGLNKIELENLSSRRRLR